MRSQSIRCLRQISLRPIVRTRPTVLRCSSSFSAPHTSGQAFGQPTVASLLASLEQDESLSGNSSVSVNGYVRSVRKQKRVAFAVVGDNSTKEPIQVVLSPEQAQGLSIGTVVKVIGEWKACAPGLKQRFEVLAKDIEVIGTADPKTYPLQKKNQTVEYLRTIPHLRSRTALGSLLLRLRSHSISALTRFFEQNEFIQTHPPIITSSDCEGAGETFQVDPTHTPKPAPTSSNDSNSPPSPPSSFFRDPKYLTVSTQLHLEALAQSGSRVWTLSPTFRAERSDTARHLSEFYMLEAELAFTDCLEDIMRLTESLIRHLAFTLSVSPIGKDLLHLQRYTDNESPIPIDETSTALADRWAKLLSPSWPRISYTSALAHLEKSYTLSSPPFSAPPPKWGSPLHTSHERYLATSLGNGSPIFVTDYPSSTKAFYALPTIHQSSTPTTPQSPPPNQTAATFDLLFPSTQCEIAGGSLREHRLSPLIAAMQERGLAKPSADNTDELEFGALKWYVDLRRWGTVPHGGFGIGFDRLLAYLAGVENVRETVAFPRWFGRCDC